jgi:hypothetical protein
MRLVTTIVQISEGAAAQQTAWGTRTLGDIREVASEDVEKSM